MLRTHLTFSLGLLVSTPVIAADKVSLHYGWTPGIHAKITGTQSREKIIAGQKQGAMSIDISYVMKTKTHPQGIAIDYQNVKSSINSDNAMMQDWMKKYMELASSSIPSYIINPAGEMAGIIGVNEMRSLTLKSLEDLLKDLPPEQKQQIITGFGQTFTEEILSSKLQSEWNMYVGQWLGAEFEDDGLYEIEYNTPVPALGNQSVKTKAQFEFSGRVNCNSADRSKSCVKLHFHSETDNVSVTELVKKMTPAGQPVPDIQVSVVSDLDLITDPRTLLPYYSKLSKRSSAPIQTPNGMMNTTQIQSSEYNYVYVVNDK